MSKRTDEKLSRLNSALPPSSSEPTPPTPSSSLLSRGNALNKLAAGKVRPTQVLLHDPKRVRIWDQHNRFYDLLSPSRCADLIEGFKRTGSQEFPAIVRRVEDDPDHDYELICGARRRWTADYLSWQLLIEVRELNDRQAFILQDLENRDREDISDYERAVDYANALPVYFGGNRSDMARFLEIDKSNFTKLIELASLPEPVVKAYDDLRDLKVHHGTQIRRWLGDGATKRRVVDKAKTLTGQALSGKAVLAALKQAASAPRSQPDAASSSSVPPVITPKQGRDGRWTLTLTPTTADPAAQRDELRQALEAWLDDAYPRKPPSA